jgi:hypothetical protein
MEFASNFQDPVSTDQSNGDPGRMMALLPDPASRNAVASRSEVVNLGEYKTPDSSQVLQGCRSIFFKNEEYSASVSASVSK